MGKEVSGGGGEWLVGVDDDAQEERTGVSFFGLE